MRVARDRLPTHRRILDQTALHLRTSRLVSDDETPHEQEETTT